MHSKLTSRFRFRLSRKVALISLFTSLIMGTQYLLPSPFLRFRAEVTGDELIDPLINLFGNRAAIATELSDIRDRGHLIIAIKNNRAPLGFIDETGNLSGFEIDIARRLAEELLGDRTAIEFVPVRNVDRINSVLNNEVDIAIAAITLTEMRRRIVDFSDPYYLDGTGFITQNSSITTIKELRTGTVALLDRSSTVPHVRFILPGAKLVGVSSYAEGQQLLASGTVDAFAGDASVLAGWLRESNGQKANETDYRILPELISADPLAVAIPKGKQHDELKAAINQSLRQWYAEGWLQERAAYWNLPAEAAQFVDIDSQ